MNQYRELMNSYVPLKFMEDSFDFVVGEEGWFVGGGLGHVAANQAKVRSPGIGEAGFEEIHPGTATFRFTGMPVGIEGAEVVICAGVMNIVKGHLGVPGFGLGTRDFDPEEF